MFDRSLSVKQGLRMLESPWGSGTSTESEEHQILSNTRADLQPVCASHSVAVKVKNAQTSHAQTGSVCLYVTGLQRESFPAHLRLSDSGSSSARPCGEASAEAEALKNTSTHPLI